MVFRLRGGIHVYDYVYGERKAEKDLSVSAVKHGRGGARPYRRFVKVKVNVNGAKS